MSNLTGQQIKNTYQGLLNLADSTTGVTTTLQAIQDGLGNNTGARIATNFFTAPNVVNLNANLIPDYMGTGFATGAGTAFAANTQNRLLYNIFYDSGTYAYSAMTYHLGTLTSTSDVVTQSFYTLQLVPGYGIAPKDLIMSGISLTSTGSTGVKTTTLPSTLSFSGTGGGYYVQALYISNAGVTPTVRYGASNIGARNQAFTESLGYFLNAAGTATSQGSRLTINPGLWFIINNLAQQASYSEADIQNNFNATTGLAVNGFALNVIK